MTPRCLSIVLGVAAILPAGCHRRSVPPPAPGATVAEAGQRTEYWPGLGLVLIPPPPAERGGDEGGEGGGGGGGGGQRFHEATVYVDGQPRVAFTYNEMPPSVKVRRYEWDTGEFANRMLVCDYLKAVGADCSVIRETHWYGGRGRVAVITGDELRRNRDRFYFDFTRGLFGKPHLEWRDGAKTNDTIDVATDLAIYVSKRPPRWDREQWSLVDEKGAPIEGVPYAPPPARRSVRVNVDGRLVARIKRNLLDGNVAPVDPAAAEPRYRLDAFLASTGVKARPRAIDLVTTDERVVRVSGPAAREIEFSAPRGRHGAVVAYTGGVPVEVGALCLYARSAAPNRPMRTLTLGPFARALDLQPARRTP